MKNNAKILVVLVITTLISCGNIDTTNVQHPPPSKKRSQTCEQIKINKQQIESFDIENEIIENWLKIGMSEHYIVKALNEYRHIDSSYFSEVEGENLKDVYFNKIGIRFTFQKLDSGFSELIKIKAEKNCVYKTRQNIGIGSLSNDVYKSYPVNESLSNDSVIIVGNYYEGLFFFITRGKVSSFVIGSGAE